MKRLAAEDPHRRRERRQPAALEPIERSDNPGDDPPGIERITRQHVVRREPRDRLDHARPRAAQDDRQENQRRHRDAARRHRRHGARTLRPAPRRRRAASEHDRPDEHGLRLRQDPGREQRASDGGSSGRGGHHRQCGRHRHLRVEIAERGAVHDDCGIEPERDRDPIGARPSEQLTAPGEPDDDEENFRERGPAL